MNKESSDTVNLRSLQILDELSRNDSLTQRELSKDLGIALGLVNSYIKNLAKKGYITVKAIPPKRYMYYLTPKGFTEKTRLTYHLLQDYTRIYRETRNNLKKVFDDIRDEGAKRIVFAGADEVAEIAYISGKDNGMKLSAVIDDEMSGKIFFDIKVRAIKDIKDMDYDCILVASYLKRNDIYKKLIKAGVPKNKVKVIFSV